MINSTLEFIVMMDLTTYYGVTKSIQVQLSLLIILIVLKRRSAVVFIMIVILTFALNVAKGLSLAIVEVT